MDEKSVEFRKCLRDDIAHLLHLYNQKNTFRYNDFVEVWNDVKFYQLLALFFYYPILYREFIKDALKISLEYLCDELDFEVRTGALYMLYGIYFHQVELPKMKILTTQSQWFEILTFISEQTKNEENADIEYIFRYLLHSDAFEFCATSNEIKGITSQYMAQKPREKKNGIKIDINETLNDFKEDLIKDTLLDELSTLHNTYIQLKADCAAENKDLPFRALHEINEDINELIGLSKNNEIESENENNRVENIDEDSTTNDTKQEAENNSVLNRRRRVRQKAANISIKIDIDSD